MKGLTDRGKLYSMAHRVPKKRLPTVRLIDYRRRHKTANKIKARSRQESTM